MADLPAYQAPGGPLRTRSGFVLRDQENHQRDRADRIDRIERIRHFAVFFGQWFDSFDATSYPCLRDVFQHEHLWFEQRHSLRREERLPARTRDSLIHSNDEVVDRCIPALRGVVLTASFRYNPASVIHRLELDPATLAGLAPQPRYLTYWGDRDSLRMRIFEVDPALRGFRTASTGAACSANCSPWPSRCDRACARRSATWH